MPGRPSADLDRDMDTPTAQDGQAVTTGAEALLREHPDALVCGLASNGLIVPVPQSVGLWGQGLIEGRALIDNVVAADRATVVRLWLRVQEEGAAAGKVRLLRKPSTWTTLHFLDLREIHGVLLGVIIPSDEEADGDGEVEELRAGGATVLLPDGGRGRQGPGMRRRLHGDVRLHDRGADRQLGARPDPPGRSGACCGGLAGGALNRPRPADPAAPQTQGRDVDVGRHDIAQPPQPPRSQLRARRDHRHLG